MRTVTLSEGECHQVLDVLYHELGQIDSEAEVSRLDRLRKRKVRRQFVRLIVKFEGAAMDHLEPEEPINEGTGALPEDREG